MRKGRPSVPTRPRAPREIGNLYETTIGKKISMAVAGLILFAYLVLHLIGNLKLYYGEQKFNEYADFLRTAGAPFFGHAQVLWIVRVILIVALFVHVLAMIQLWRKSSAARKVGYRKYDPDVFSSVSRSMKWGGIAILAFVVYHILHLTTGTLHTDFVPGNPYHNVVVGFHQWWNSVIYCVGVIAVGLHLYHGLWSVFQTMGWNNVHYNRLRRPIAIALSAIITLGFLSIPFAVWTGIAR